MIPDSPPPDNLDLALAEKGFVFLAPQTGRWRGYQGSLRVGEAEYPCSLRVDVRGFELPEISLTPVPPALPAVVPHLGAGGWLCYAAKGSIVLDIFDIPGQVLACIERAELVLSKILAGEMADDLAEEFFAYWGGKTAFSDFRPSSNQAVELLMFKKGQEEFCVISNDAARTTLKMAALGFTHDKNLKIEVARVKTKAPPRPLQGTWPPRVVKDLLRWQGELDPMCRKKLDEHILEARKKHLPTLLCVVESPKTSYGVLVDLSRATPSSRSASSHREFTYNAPVTPAFFIPISDEYIASRNSPKQATLVGKKIALVGCGTIGGFLAEMLLKAGAGIDRGELALIDNDILLPQNIGRHRLGFNAIRQSKSVALTAELKHSSPAATIQSIDEDVLDVVLDKYDLIVNATGEEALGHLLSKRYNGATFVPTLSIWIEGPGTAIRGLMRETTAAACVRCLSSADRAPLFPVIKEAMPQELAGHGCENLYVPFSMTVSIQAACLAHEMAIAWAAGAIGNRLITRVLDERYTAGTEKTNPPRQAGCPACDS